MSLSLQELEERSVDLVGAALHGDRGDRAAAEADFGRVGVGLDLELLERFDRGHEVGDVDARILASTPSRVTVW
ncbi:MAG: hypothetical protein R2724_23245 [Bryobacterales bacterium]